MRGTGNRSALALRDFQRPQSRISHMRHVLVAATLLALAPAALGGGGPPNRIDGTIYADTLSGTTRADDIRGSNGNDDLYGGEGLDRLDGGQGADWLFGGDADDVLLGGQPPFWDYLRRERLLGGGGNDLLTSVMPGAVLVGGPGDDRLRPDGRDCEEDLNAKRRLMDFGRCVNFSLGNVGDDRIWARDGASDWIQCGPGEDRVHSADRIDYVAADCEHVRRAAG